VDLEVAILGILRHHIQEGNRMALIRKDGDLDSGVVLLLGRQLDTWRGGLAITDSKNRC